MMYCKPDMPQRTPKDKTVFSSENVRFSEQIYKKRTRHETWTDFKSVQNEYVKKAVEAEKSGAL